MKLTRSVALLYRNPTCDLLTKYNFIISEKKNVFKLLFHYDMKVLGIAKVNLRLFSLRLAYRQFPLQICLFHFRMIRKECMES